MHKNDHTWRTKDWGAGIALSMALLRKNRVNKIIPFHPSYSPPKGAWFLMPWSIKMIKNWTQKFFGKCLEMGNCRWKFGCNVSACVGFVGEGGPAPWLLNVGWVILKKICVSMLKSFYLFHSLQVMFETFEFGKPYKSHLGVGVCSQFATLKSLDEIATSRSFPGSTISQNGESTLKRFPVPSANSRQKDDERWDDGIVFF